jgi:hypothetical protein
VTGAAKEAFALVFEQMGGVEAFAAWALRHTGDFYRLYGD